MVISAHTTKLEILELSNVKTKPTENHEDNGATLPLRTQPSSSYSPLTDILVVPDKPPTHACIKDGDAALQAHVGYLLYFCLLGSDYMLSGVYQDWVHQNPWKHMYDRITENGRWQAK